MAVNTRDFAIATINVCSIEYDKVFAISSYLDNNPPQLLIITETHKSSIPSWFSFDKLPNTIHRTGTSHSGGISVFSSEPITERSNIILHQENTIAFEINTPAGPRIIVGAYCFSDEENIDCPRYHALLNNITESISKSRHPVIIIGDFNMKHPEWSPLSKFPAGTKPTEQAILFKETLSSHDLYVVNTLFPTSAREATHRGGNVLDLILTNMPQSFSSCSIIKYYNTGIRTDHHMVRATIRPTQHQHSPSNYQTTSLPPKWLVKKANWKQFTALCESQSNAPEIINIFQSAPHLYPTQTTQQVMNQLWTSFSNILLSAANAAVPTCPRHQHYRRNWWTAIPDIPLLHQRFTQLLQRYRRHKQSENARSYRDDYRVARNEFRQACNEAKRLSFAALSFSIQGERHQPDWQAFRRSTGNGNKKANLSCVKDANGNLPTNTAHSMDNVAEYLRKVNTLPTNLPDDNKHDDMVHLWVEHKTRERECNPLDNDFTNSNESSNQSTLHLHLDPTIYHHTSLNECHHQQHHSYSNCSIILGNMPFSLWHGNKLMLSLSPRKMVIHLMQHHSVQSPSLH